MTYIYSFVIWPDETCDFTKSLFRYFRVFRKRTEMTMTEEQFKEFKLELEHDGFSLRECTRYKYVEPEQVC